VSEQGEGELVVATSWMVGGLFSRKNRENRQRLEVGMSASRLQSCQRVNAMAASTVEKLHLYKESSRDAPDRALGHGLQVACLLDVFVAPRSGWKLDLVRRSCRLFETSLSFLAVDNRLVHLLARLNRQDSSIA